MDEPLEPNSQEPSGPKPLLHIGERIRGIAAYSILIGCLGLGATIATIFWSSSNTNLQNDLRRTQEELAKVRDELEKVKSDYARYATEHPTKYAGGQNKDSVGTTAARAQSGSKGENQVEVRVKADAPATVLDDLHISLVGTELTANPPRYKVTATVVTPGYEPMTIVRADIGYMATYSQKGNFDIQVLAADTLSAKFLVTRKGN